MRRRALAVAFLLAPAALACASRGDPITEVQSPAGGGRGYRALFRGESEGPGGRARFRVAIALLPPDSLRLEFLGPAGGPRFIVAAADGQAAAILPSERAYERAPADSRSMEHLLGLPLDAARLVALITGRPMCRPDAAQETMQTKSAATFGRTLAWYEIVCPPDEIRYQARSDERGGVLRQASIRDGLTGAMMLEVEYGDHEEGRGPRWPKRIRLRLPLRQSSVTLAAIDGPLASDLEESIFTPQVPDGFETRPDLLSLPAPGLLGSTGERER